MNFKLLQHSGDVDVEIEQTKRGGATVDLGEISYRKSSEVSRVSRINRNTAYTLILGSEYCRRRWLSYKTIAIGNEAR
jgi:hypothetical protein